MRNYYCKFDDAGKRIDTVPDFLADSHGGADALIAAGYIKVPDDEYQYYAGNQGDGDNGTGYARSSDGKPVSAAAYVQTTAEKLTAVKSTYESQIADLKDALATATLAADDTLIASLKTDYATAMTAYQTALKEVS
ncbi:hypothetical protein [Pectinatus frisingensis]|uniref:hypothetical protein n=1 Tax=Pectinatus frisingensis TaxID=865 RepID=UPI0018C77639|nr:hypothetical protein [Pectinatus frisingensis]